jgi:hypothetical protein
MSTLADDDYDRLEREALQAVVQLDGVATVRPHTTECAPYSDPDDGFCWRHGDWTREPPPDTRSAPDPHLRVIPGGLGPIQINTALVRRFLGVAADEPIELTALAGKRVHVAHARNAAEHARLLRDSESIRGLTGIFMLVNGPMDPTLLHRYEPGGWHVANNGRATDRDIRGLRSFFIDVDVQRPKGISATDEELAMAGEVADRVEDFLAAALARVTPGGGLRCPDGVLRDYRPIGRGNSGNGVFLLVALEPCEPTTETTQQISGLLKLLNTRFGTEQVKIDASVSNPARLMPAPGTMKRKGTDTLERPHRRTMFSCCGNVVRVPIKELCE